MKLPEDISPLSIIHPLFLVVFHYQPLLVGALEHVFHSVGNFIIPTDELSIIFQRGGFSNRQSDRVFSWVHLGVHLGVTWTIPKIRLPLVIMGPPSDTPLAIVISIINHSYWSYKTT